MHRTLCLHTMHICLYCLIHQTGFSKGAVAWLQRLPGKPNTPSTLFRSAIYYCSTSIPVSNILLIYAIYYCFSATPVSSFTTLAAKPNTMAARAPILCQYSSLTHTGLQVTTTDCRLATVDYKEQQWIYNTQYGFARETQHHHEHPLLLWCKLHVINIITVNYCTML